MTYRKHSDIYLDLDKSNANLRRDRWQMHYFHGEGVSGTRFAEHQNKLNLRTFRKPG